MEFRQHILVLLAGVLVGCAGRLEQGERRTEELEEEIARTRAELDGLAKMTLRTGEGSFGYRSRPFPQPDRRAFVRIDFDGEHEIDEIIIVPALWKTVEGAYEADGFPIEFSITLGGNSDEAREVIRFDQSAELLPRLSPVVVNGGGQTASWIEIDATLLSEVVWEEVFLLQLSEVLVFSGRENVALNQKVQVGAEKRFELWSPERINDGFTPYLMDSGSGEGSVAFLSEAGLGDDPHLFLDLGAVETINQIHLHRLDLADTVPQISRSDNGLPRMLVVRGGVDNARETAQVITQFEVRSPYDVGPVLMEKFPGIDCRYLWFEITEPDIRPHYEDNPGKTQIGLAEIEVFSNGENVAMGREVVGNFTPHRYREFRSLTDGKNFYGELLPIRDWLIQLAERHDLERALPELEAELAARYQRQRSFVKWLVGALVLLGVAGLIWGYGNRVARDREVQDIRRRLAADLHDELGASLHTVGVLSDLAEQNKQDSDKLTEVLKSIRQEAEISAEAVQRCGGVLEGGGDFESLERDMRRLADRIGCGLAHRVEVEVSDGSRVPPVRVLEDVFLFYKECLVNILRHAEATEFRVSLNVEAGKLLLTVEDNGVGPKNRYPKSLRRRARLLGGKVRVAPVEGGGMKVQLHYRYH